MGKIESSASKLEDQIQLLSAKLTELAAKTDVAGKQAKIDSRKHVDELKAKIAATQAKLNEAKAAGSEKWDSFKDGLESSWKEIEGTFKSLTH